MNIDLATCFRRTLLPLTTVALTVVTTVSMAAESHVAPSEEDMRLYDIATAPSATRLHSDVEKLVSFGTRHTLSDTKSDTQGIGAARRWIKAEFEQISKACGGCLEVITLGVEIV